MCVLLQFDMLENKLERTEYCAAFNSYYALDGETNKEIVDNRGEASVKNKILAIKAEWNFKEFSDIKIVGDMLFFDDVQGVNIDDFYLSYMGLINALYYFDLDWYCQYEEQINRELPPIVEVDQWGNQWRIPREVYFLNPTE